MRGWQDFWISGLSSGGISGSFWILMAAKLPIYEIEPRFVARLREHRRVIVSGAHRLGQIHPGAADAAGARVAGAPARSSSCSRGGWRRACWRRAWRRERHADWGGRSATRSGSRTSPAPRPGSGSSPKASCCGRWSRIPTCPASQALIFDEFHERHLYGDITLARALDLQETRAAGPAPHRDVRHAGRGRAGGLPAAVPGAGIAGACLPGGDRIRCHARLRWTSGPSGSWPPRPSRSFVRSGGEGDVLVFMPGGFEISQTIEAIRHCAEVARVHAAAACTANCRPRDQDAAVARYDQPQGRGGDQCGRDLADHRRHPAGDRQRPGAHPALRSLPRDQHAADREDQPASADQRAGRAGRTAPGRLPPAVVARGTRAPAGAGTAGGQAARSGGGGADA